LYLLRVGQATTSVRASCFASPSIEESAEVALDGDTAVGFKYRVREAYNSTEAVEHCP
jgi:hypothetical protein